MLSRPLARHGRIAAVVLAVVFAGCDTGGPGETAAPQAELLVRCCADLPSLDDGHFHAAVWRGDRVFAIGPLTEFRVGASAPYVVGSRRRVRAVSDGFSFEQSEDVQGFYLTADRSGDRLLFVRGPYLGLVAGSLRLYAPATDRLDVLLPAERNVGTAVFWPGQPDRVVYYQYGASLAQPEPGPEADQAGFRALDLRTGADVPLAPYAPADARSQTYAGFDVSPDGRTLLYALSADATTGAVVPPRVVARDLASGAADTLDVAGLALPGLWLRYHPDGRHVLYANYTEFALTPDARAASEWGVLDLGGAAAGVLAPRVVEPAYPAGTTGASIVVSPEWAPNGSDVLLGRLPLYPGPDGGAGSSSLYVVRGVL